jgi:hypothetical protein
MANYELGLFCIKQFSLDQEKPMFVIPSILSISVPLFMDPMSKHSVSITRGCLISMEQVIASTWLLKTLLCNTMRILPMGGPFYGIQI